MYKFVSIFLVLTVFGCGDDNSGAVDGSATNDGGPDGSDVDAADHGAPSTTYPAFMPDVAAIVNNGGPVMANLVIVTVTWTSDPNVADYESFTDALGASNYWRTLNMEYGVGPATSGAANHVHITTPPPAMMTGTDVVNLVVANASNASSGWPAPTTQTVYNVFIDPTTSLTGGGSSLCAQGVGGYHSDTNIGGRRIAYAVNMHCPLQGYLDVIATASHELNEVATDPLPRSNPAYVGFDNDHLNYDIMDDLQDETGDACEFYASSYYTSVETGFNFYVQRQWSNASARAGHNPCVPTPPGVYYATTVFPDQEDTITVDMRSVGLGQQQTKGFKATMGQPRTFQIGFFSDAATGGPWHVTATVDAMMPLTGSSGSPVANGTADVTIDKPDGQNGEKAFVTVTPQTYSSLGIIYLSFKSSLAGHAAHTVPVLIGR